MLDFRDYYLNNEEEMESLIIDYFKIQRKNRERAGKGLGQGWPNYRDADIPGFAFRGGNGSDLNTHAASADIPLNKFAEELKKVVRLVLEEEAINPPADNPGRVADKAANCAKLLIAEAEGGEGNALSALFREVIGFYAASIS